MSEKMAACLMVNKHISLYDSHKICRLCGYYASPMLSILKEDSTNTTYREKIVYCMSFEVSDLSKLPTQICKTCAKLIESFYSFKTRCIDVNLQFMELIERDGNENTDLKTTIPSKLETQNQQFKNSYTNPLHADQTPTPFTQSIPTVNKKRKFTRARNLPINSSAILVDLAMGSISPPVENTLPSTFTKIEPNSISEQKLLLNLSCDKSIKTEADAVKDLTMFQSDPLELVICSYDKDVQGQDINLQMGPVMYTNNNVEKQTEHLNLNVKSELLPNESPSMNSNPHDGSRPTSCIENSCNSCGTTINSNGKSKDFMCLACQELKGHENNYIYECNLCSEMFKSKNTLSKHLKYHPRRNKFKCIFCDIICDNSNILQMHLKSKHEMSTNLKCSFCKTRRPYKSLSTFLTHMNKVHNMNASVESTDTDDLDLDELHQTSTHTESLNAHQSTSRVDDGLVLEDRIEKTESKQQFACEVCKYVFNGKHLLADHIAASHDMSKLETKYKKSNKTKDPSLCSYCGKIFSTTTLLSQHIRLTHLCIKTHKCKLCDKSYSKKSVLRNHIEAVHEKKKFQCSLCGSLLSSFNSLHSHMRMHRNKNKAPTVKCPICPKLFKHKKNVDRHMRSHTGETPYKCSHCPREFTLQWNLIQHERLHTGEKRYKCEKCGKAFTHNVSRKNHMKYHKDDLEVVTG